VSSRTATDSVIGALGDARDRIAPTVDRVTEVAREQIGPKLAEVAREQLAPRLADVLSAAAERINPEEAGQAVAGQAEQVIRILDRAAERAADVAAAAALRASESLQAQAKRHHRRWPWVLLGIGVAIGAAAAMRAAQARRAEDEEWASYRPEERSPATIPHLSDTKDDGADTKIDQTVKNAKAAVSDAVEAATDKTTDKTAEAIPEVTDVTDNGRRKTAAKPAADKVRDKSV
jgi:hypothetical protein